MKPFIAVFILLLSTKTIFAQGTTTVNYADIYSGKTKIIGELGKPFGTIVTVKGILVNYFSKRSDSGPNLIVQMINDSAIQSYIQIPVRYFMGSDDNLTGKLEFGATYKFRGFEEGRYTGTPQKVIELLFSGPQTISYDTTKDGTIATISPGYPPQSSPFHFQNILLATNWEKIEPITWHPEQFTQTKGLLSGIAKNEGDTAVLEQAGWQIKLPGLKKWENKIIGKPAEIYGLFKKTGRKDVYIMETGWAQPASLEDQVGQVVKLRGTAMSMNGYWWFSYRGIDMYVENMEKMPGWSVDNHFRKMEITGLLVQEELPRIDQITLKRDRDKKMYYVLKNASWAPIDGLLLPELKYDKYGIKY